MSYINNLIQGDCLEEMDKLIEKKVKVDAIITDPPYGNMDTDGGRKLGINKWDKKLKPSDIFSRCDKLLRKNGRLILFSQDPYTYELQTNQIPNLSYNYKMLWLKDNFANALGCNRNPVNFTEEILVFTKKECYDAVHPLRNKMNLIGDKYGHDFIIDLFLKEGRYSNVASAKVHASYKFGFGKGMRFDLMDEKLYNFMKQYIDFNYSYEELKQEDIKYKEQYKSTFNLKEGEKFKSNVLEYKKDYEGLHPTQKPISLIEDLVRTFTDENNTILDFTMGSGTTPMACIKNNRKFVGIELDSTYYNLSKNRVNKYINDNNLQNTYELIK